MDTQRLANPHCPICKGDGRVKDQPGNPGWAICQCVLLAQRKRTAETIIASVFPEGARQMSFASYQPGGIAQNEQALKVARNFVDNYPRARENGWALGFWGAPRSGKTHLAVAIAQACVKRYLARPMVLNLPKALRQERERYSNADIPSPFTQAATADLLILDDLGAEYERQGDDPSRSSWLVEQVYTLLDDRLMQNLPLIYTTNLSPGDIKKRYSNENWQRVISRISGAEVVPPIEVLAVAGSALKDPEAAKLLYG